MKILSVYNFNSHSIPVKRLKSVNKNAGEIAKLETEIGTNSKNIDTNYVRIQDNEDKISTNNEDITNNTAVIIWEATRHYVHWFSFENQQSPIYVVNWHFSGCPDRW